MIEEPPSELARCVKLYEEERSAGITALNRGHLETAERHFRRASALAVELGDERREQLASCNLSAVRIERGHGGQEVSELRTHLMEPSDDEVAFLASYNIARAYEVGGELRKALFYARIAQNRAISAGRPEWQASSHNQSGNLLIYRSRFDEASDEYERALELVPDTVNLRRALWLLNLGYCRFVQKRHQQGFSLAFRALRMFRRLGATLWIGQAHTDLSFGYLEIDRPERARRHAERGLAFAREVGDQDGLKNALYLLGEAAQGVGDIQTAREAFEELERHFPGAAHLSNLLLEVDLRGLVNLRT